jgi:polyketide biosynthesis enoyl-CoA hydratase PksI
MTSAFVIERAAGGLRRVRIATDEAPHLGPDSVARLRTVVETVNADADARVLFVEGGERHFCSGATRDLLLAPDAAGAIAPLMRELPRLLMSVRVPTVALMRGHAVGGGFVLGLWCDLVFLAEEALYGTNFVSLGFTPGMGSTVALEEALGGPMARELLLSGCLVKGRELKARGAPLGHGVVPRAEVEERALAFAEASSSASLAAVVATKQHLVARRRARFESVIDEECELQAAALSRAGTRASINESYAVSLFAQEPEEES